MLIDGDRRWWLPVGLVGVACGLPFLLFRYLPLVDWPLHQLELAIDVNPGFGAWYEPAGWSLPYWLPLRLGALLSPLLGVELASRAVLFGYAAGLPLAGGLLARGLGASGWWGLLLAPFVLEFNLAYGFVAYCMGGLLLLLVIAAALRAERADRAGGSLLSLALASAAVGWTHPQMAVAAAGTCLGLQLLGDAPWRRRAAVVAASLPALVPSAIWFTQPASAQATFASAPVFQSAGALLGHLARFSVDVMPGRLEEISLGLVAALLVGLWFAHRRRPSRLASRLPLAALGFLALYFVLPWEWGGQALCQRMPYLALLMLPALVPPGARPTRAMRWGLVCLALVSAANNGLAFRAFDLEVASRLDPMVERVPPGARLAWVAHDVSTEWVHAPAYLHAGAWATLQRGGVYSFHFNRLTSRYTDRVPAAQTFVGREFQYRSHFRDTGGLLVVPGDRLSFWDTFLIRWPRGVRPLAPLEVDPAQILSLDVLEPWGLLRLRRESRLARRDLIGQ